MTIADRSDTWSKSSYSTNTDNCVEVSHGALPGVGVRDTKDRAGGHLAVPASSWAAFTLEVKARS
jgi:hypothetical protein